MYIYRKAVSDEKEQCIELANYVFSTAHRPHDFETLIPKVYGPDEDSAPLHRVAVRDDGRIRAEIAALPEVLHVGSSFLNAGFIGTVCVHPKERGAGHMKRLMQDTVKELEDSYDLAILGGQRQRYEYFGFTKGGMEFLYEMDAVNVRHKASSMDMDAYDFLPAEDISGFPSYAAEKNASRMLYAKRPTEKIMSILSTYYGEPIAVVKNGNLSGYLILSCKNEISEIALDDEADTAAVVSKYLIKNHIDTLTIHLPIHQQRACASLSAIAEEVSISSPGNCMYQIFRFDRVLPAFLELKASLGLLVPGTLEIWIENQPLTISFDGKTLLVQHSAPENAIHLTRFQAQELFLSYGGFAGLRPPSLCSDEYEKWRSRIPCSWFPLPMFLYRADEF